MASEGKHTVAGVDITRRYMLGCMQSMHIIVVCILYKTDDFNVYKATTFLVNISVLLFGQLRITYSDIPVHFCCVVKSLVHAREHIISITLTLRVPIYVHSMHLHRLCRSQSLLCLKSRPACVMHHSFKDINYSFVLYIVYSLYNMQLSLYPNDSVAR